MAALWAATILNQTPYPASGLPVDRRAIRQRGGAVSLYGPCWLRPQGIPRRGTAARRAGQYCAWRAAAGGDFCGKTNPAPAALCAGIGAVCTRRGKSVPPPLLRFASFGAFQRMRPPGARAGVAPSMILPLTFGRRWVVCAP